LICSEKLPLSWDDVTLKGESRLAVTVRFCILEPLSFTKQLMLLP